VDAFGKNPRKLIPEKINIIKVTMSAQKVEA